MEDNDKEITIDFRKIKNLFKKKKKQEIEKIEEEIRVIKSDLNQNITKEKTKLEALKSDQEAIIKSEQTIQKDQQLAESIDKDEEILNKDIEEAEETIEKTKKDIKKDYHTDTKIAKEDITEKDDVIRLNLKNIKDTFKSVEWAQFFKKYGVLFLILIPMFFSVYFRIYPSYLPITDEWARSSVHNSYQSQISSQISQQYPNLPDANKNALVAKEFEKMLAENQAQIDEQIKGTSDYFKSRFKDESGQTYLLAIDPYLWYGQARNYVNYGHPGDIMVNGSSIYSLRNGRFGKATGGFKLHPLIEVITYKIVRIFNKNFTLLRSAFLSPVLIIALSIIPIFFIARRFGGNVSGLFAAMILAINSSLLSRTPAGFADTDAYNILIPLFAVWIFLEAFESQTLKKKITLTVLSGIVTSIYPLIWTGWSYIFNFILGTIGIYLVYTTIRNYTLLKKGFLNYLSFPAIKETLLILGAYILSVGIFVTWFIGNTSEFFGAFTRVFKFIKLKEVAVNTLWPNVLTTVAEFNPPQLKDIISHMGGRTLFAIAIIGIILTLIKKNKAGRTDVKYAALLIIWFVGTAYSFTKGVRFAILMVPAFAISFGIATGVSFQFFSKIMTKELHLNKYFSRIFILILISLLLISPLKAADRTGKNELPSMCDAWYESLTAIKEDSEDAIITSWWDFGHWFVTIAERRVTFDGGDQQRRIHWVGKSLLSSNEDENIGILKMLNCGQERAFDVLNAYIKDGVKSIKILNELFTVNRSEAKSILLSYGLKDNEAESVLELTHCEDLIKQYYITSEDMIGKAGVWAHFGSWNFQKARIWQTIRGKSYDEGIKILTNEFNLSIDSADRYYYEIQGTKADQWISPWPGYRSGINGCSKSGDILQCGTGAIINLSSMDAKLPTQEGIKNPRSFVYNTDYDIIEKKYDDNTVPISVVLIKDGDSYKTLLSDPELAASMFTRLFFFNGIGSKHYTILSDRTTVTGQRVIVWSVDWEEHDPITLVKKETITENKTKVTEEENLETNLKKPDNDSVIEKEIEPDQITEEISAKSGDTVDVYYIGYLDDGSVFDSSIIDWTAKNITKDTEFAEDLGYKPLTFMLGSGQVIPGFDSAINGLSIGEETTVNIAPENAYGTDPDTHPLGNKTLNFKIKLINIQ
ncbi:MAG: STT3 domain-containing protein [Nanoarchaeota archaeon]